MLGSTKSLLDDDDVALIDAPTLPLSASNGTDITGAASDAVVETVGEPVVGIEAANHAIAHMNGTEQQQGGGEEEEVYIEQELLQINQAPVTAVGDNNSTRVSQLYKGIQTPLRGTLPFPSSISPLTTFSLIYIPYHYTGYNSDT